MWYTIIQNTYWELEPNFFPLTCGAHGGELTKSWIELVFKFWFVLFKSSIININHIFCVNRARINHKYAVCDL